MKEEMVDFISQFMEIYSFRDNQHGEKRCKNCRCFKRRLSDYEAGALKQFVECLPEAYKADEFSICKAASNMLLETVTEELERKPVFVSQNGHCTLFKMAILKAIKYIFRKQGGRV